MLKKNKTKKQPIKILKCKSITQEEECLSRVDCLFNKSNKCQQKSLTKKRIDIKNKEEENISFKQPQIIIKSGIPVKKNKTKKRIALEIEEAEQPQIIIKDISNSNKNTNIKTDSKSELDLATNVTLKQVSKSHHSSKSHYSSKSHHSSKSPHRNNPCEEHQQLKDSRKILNEQIAKKNGECEESKFGSIQKYFNNEEDKTTCKDLLIALQKLYIDAKTKDPNYSLYFHTFIQMFARDTMVKLKFKRQHVFEAVCKLMLLFNYDNFELGSNKQFYRSIAKFIMSPNNSKMDKGTILKSALNEGNDAGVVDIFFESKYKKSDSICKDDWVCDCDVDPYKKNEGEGSKEKRQFILIQNKYYENEKAVNKAYDVAEIYAKAEELNNIVEGVVDKKIVLMINNKESLDQKITRSKDKSINNLVYKIYGVKELEDWFRRFVNDLFETKNIEIFLKDRGEESQIKPKLAPKFHQQVFTQSTLRYNAEENYKLFIWGAVPRSGKSYMIADFISKNKYRPIGEQNNDIVLILGAKSETECQFIKMFCDLADFNDYGIISASTGITKSCVVKECNLNPKIPKDKNIYIFSQEWFKNQSKNQSKIHTVNENTGPINKDMTLEQIQDILTGLNKPIQNNKGEKYIKKALLKLYTNKPNKSVIDQSSYFDKTVVIEKFAKLFEKRKIDLFFDEIHKGGSTNNSENILYAFINAGVKIDIFIMVTATFAKPNLRYNSFINIDTSNKGLKIIEWGYEDQQNMKQVTNNTNEEIMLNSRSVNGKEVERAVMQNIFQKYKDEYGEDNYLKIIAEEYAKHPELVLIQPEIINPGEYVDVRNIFDKILSCNACKIEQSLADLRNPNKIFTNTNKVNEVKKLFSFIGNRQSDEIGMPHLDSKCVYAHLAKMGAPIHTPHSELWFLPDKDLYDNAEYCRFGDCSKVDVKKDQNNDEDDDEKTGLPNIEPLTRGLAFLLMSDSYFKEMYNVLIVHNTDIKYKQGTVKLNSDIIFGDPDGSGPIYHAIGTNSLSESIKMVEQKTFNPKSPNRPKSLIILTGAKLRLGISLPCVDIAFNFDNISSVDNNYQTMFRVLTERTYQSKPYGYYIDFNKDRAINFLYDYNNTYGAGKRIADFKTKTEYLHSLLILFNYNGLGLIKQDTNKQLKLYNLLINDLKLDETSYQNFNLSPKNIENMVKKALLDVDILLLKKLKETVRISYDKQSDRKVKKVIIEGQKARTAAAPNVDHDPNEEESKKEEEEDDNALIINAIAQILPPIVALLALFSNKNNYNCETLDDCINNCKKQLDELVELCSCDGDNINNSSVLACYMKYQSPIPYNKAELKYLLDEIQKIIGKSDQLKVNLNIIFSNIRNSMGKNDNALIFDMTPEKIQEKIEQYLPVREAEKNKNGEVFTPTQLIDEILNKLPPSVWSNHDLKWLDPANGIGNFPMVAYQKLLKGLEQWEPNKNKRSKHIIENMLYMVEINPKNIKISKKIFGSNSNICCADFLKDSEKCFKQFGVDKFDIIMGNPPFQPEKTEDDKRQGGHGGKLLWDKFIIKSLELLLHNSYLCFITPSSWRKPENKLYNLMTKDNQLIYLHIFSKKQGQQLFDVNQRIDVYVIQKHSQTKNTEIIDELDNKIELDVTKWVFLPNYDFENIKKIMTTEEEGIKVFYDTTYHTQNAKKKNPNIKAKPTEKYKYPVVHSINQDGLVFWYTDDKTNGHFGVPKVLLNFNEQQYPVNDYEGKYGMSQITFGIPITSKKQGDDIVKAINTDAFKNIIKATKWGAFQTDWRMFKYFKPDFYKQFLKDKQSTKIQSLTRGHQQRNKTKKIKSGIVKIQAITRGHQQRKKTKNQNNKKGGKKKTLKHSSIFKFWK